MAVPVGLTCCNIPIQGEDCSFSCSTVSFTLNLRHVCNGSTVGIIARVVDASGNVHAVVCRTVAVNDPAFPSCECLDSYPVDFDDVVVDEDCVAAANLSAECCSFNYITNPCCCQSGD